MHESVGENELFPRAPSTSTLHIFLPSGQMRSRCVASTGSLEADGKSIPSATIHNAGSSLSSFHEPRHMPRVLCTSMQSSSARQKCMIIAAPVQETGPCGLIDPFLNDPSSLARVDATAFPLSLGPSPPPPPPPLHTIAPSSHDWLLLYMARDFDFPCCRLTG